MSMMRLDKYICDTGIATRSQAKQLIKSGRVTVDGVPVLSGDAKIDSEHVSVIVDGKTVTYSRYRYFVMNKPSGVITATDDRKQKTVIDLLPPELQRIGLFPVGRLDKDTTGLLLLTNDGDFAHRVISPKSEIWKVYEAETSGTPDESDVRAFSEGIVLADGTKCLPAKLEIIGENICHVTVMEGKYHQVKRMLASVGKPVVRLTRLSVGGLSLNKMLTEGSFRELDNNELCIVMNKK